MSSLKGNRVPATFIEVVPSVSILNFTLESPPQYILLAQSIGVSCRDRLNGFQDAELYISFKIGKVIAFDKLPPFFVGNLRFQNISNVILDIVFYHFLVIVMEQTTTRHIRGGGITAILAAHPFPQGLTHDFSTLFLGELTTNQHS